MKGQHLAIVGIAIGLVALALSGVIYASNLSGKTSLRVRTLEIVDAKQNPRATLAVDSKGEPALKFLDLTGNVLFQIPPQMAASESTSFEIRDFKIKKVGGAYSSYQGRGTLLAKDARFQNRNILVVLLERESKKGTEPNERIYSVPVKNGVGTVETWDIGEQGGKFDPPEYQWVLLGYVELQPGSLVPQK